MNPEDYDLTKISDYKLVYTLLKSIMKSGQDLIPDIHYLRFKKILEKMNKRLQDGNNPEL